MSYYVRNEFYGEGTCGAYYAFTANPSYGWCMGFDKDMEPQMFSTDDFGKKAFSTRLVQ